MSVIIHSKRFDLRKLREALVPHRAIDHQGRLLKSPKHLQKWAAARKIFKKIESIVREGSNFERLNLVKSVSSRVNSDLQISHCFSLILDFPLPLCFLSSVGDRSKGEVCLSIFPWICPFGEMCESILKVDLSQESNQSFD